jgi:DNA-binding LacI/PurR family transcriptional regulator
VSALARRPTIADVAEGAGVSKTTVSFAFNQPERLPNETVDRIRSVALSLGYRPNPIARMLTQRRTRTIGVLTPQALAVMFGNPFFSAFSAGVASTAESAGYSLLFISPLQGSLGRAVSRAAVDGVVAVGLSPHHPEIEEIVRAGLPMVAVDSSALPDQLAVDVDDETGARLAAEHLVGLGHRDILILAIEPSEQGAGRDPDDVPERRLRGYRSALRDAGIEVAAGSIFMAPSTVDGGESAFFSARDAGRRPTGVLAMSDALAIGTLRAAHRLGMDVPRDLSVIGYDDVEGAADTHPPLTTVHQPIREKGELAARMLLATLDGKTPTVPARLPTRLVVRSSAGRPPIAEDH